MSSQTLATSVTADLLADSAALYSPVSASFLDLLRPMATAPLGASVHSGQHVSSRLMRTTRCSAVANDDRKLDHCHVPIAWELQPA